MRYLGKVKYNGTNYHGWQKQENANSVQEEIENVLSKILNTRTTIYGSGRTDAGVHALGQTFHFDIEKDIDVDKFVYSVNMLLPKDIFLLELLKVNDDFHARFSAKEKHYLFRLNIGKRDPFNLNKVMEFPCKKFDIDLFKKALLEFVGTYSFVNFTSKEEDEDNFVRSINVISVCEENNIINIDLYGNGFMRYMIRYIIGTALAVESGKEDISFIRNRLTDKNRNVVQYKADACGLYLIDVIY